MPSLARSVPKPLKVPSLARSMPKPLSLSLSLCMSVFLALYPSILAGRLPHSGFQIFDAETETSVFAYLCKKLRDIDFDYFIKTMMEENTKFLFEVVLTFDIHDVLDTNFDFAAFPYLRHVKEEDLSREQCETAKRLGRNLSKEKSKLVSSLEAHHCITDFTSNILYLLAYKGMKIVSIRSVVAFKSFNYLNPYIEGLQLARKKAPSVILGKLLKSLGM